MYETGCLLKITQNNFCWGNDPNTLTRVNKNSIVMFISENEIPSEEVAKNWKRLEWNLKVLHPVYNLIWIASEYTTDIL